MDIFTLVVEADRNVCWAMWNFITSPATGGGKAIMPGVELTIPSRPTTVTAPTAIVAKIDGNPVGEMDEGSTILSKIGFYRQCGSE